MSSDVPVPAPVSRLVAGVAVLGAVVLLAGVAVSARGEDAAATDTTVAAVSGGALLVTPAGSRPAQRGDVVPHGGRVETAGGTAQLRSGGAVVELARNTTVTVVDGARQRLTEGAALVKATRGLTLASPALSVRVPEEAVARLDTGDVVATVASYRGSPRVGVPGRAVRTVVPRLHQLELVAGSTPDAPSPLALHDDGDPWEQVELPTVVANDMALNTYATTFARPGSPVVASLPPALRSPDRALAAERAVAYALASGRADRRYREALSYRADGGSWGVVAALVKASSSDAEGYVDALGGPDTSIVLADSAPDAEMVLPGLATAEPVRPSASPSASGAAPSPSSGTSPRPRPSAGTSPSPSPGVVPEPVADVLAPVLDLLPVEVPLLPKPSPSASRKPQVPVVGPLVDGLLTPSR